MNYERGLTQMKQRLQHTISYPEFLLLELRMQENVQNERRYGTNEQSRSDRIRILEQLNLLALQDLHISFNDLCITQASLFNTEKITSNAEDRNTSATRTGKNIFICCSHRDKKYVEELRLHMAQIGRQKMLHLWDNTQIPAGSQRKEEITKALQASNITILLISVDFFASSIITQYELPDILRAEKQKRLTILCIIVRPCTFASSELAMFQTMNDPQRPLSTLNLAERETAWAHISNQIEQLYSANNGTNTSFHQETIGETS